MGPSRPCHLSRKVSFISMTFLTATFFIVEITVGYVTNSMALVADSFHMLSDVVSLLVGYIALKYSKVSCQSHTYTFGYARAEVLGALVNAVFLVALCFSIVVEALKRLVITEKLDNPVLVLITGGVGLFVNIIGLVLFRQHGHGHSHAGHGAHGHESNHENVIEDPLLQEEITIESNALITAKNDRTLFVKTKGDENSRASASQLNIRGVYLHVLGDALGSIIVMVSAAIVHVAKAKWTLYVDPVMSIIMVVIILKTSLPLLKESSMILMQTVPTHIKLKEIQERLVKQIPSVVSVHEFHIWQLAGNRIIASAHVRCNSVPEYMSLANQLKEFFHDEGIHSTTIQPEFIDSIVHDPTRHIDNDFGCALECKVDCYEKTCCGQLTPPPVDSPEKDKRFDKKDVFFGSSDI